MSDGANGLAVLNDGLREYEVTDTDERRLKLTLMRAYQVELTTVSWRWERHPEMELTQNPGKHKFVYRILPHSGKWDDARAFAEAERLNLPVEVAQTCARPGHLPQELSFLSLGPIDLVMSGMKPAEDGDGLVVRCYNPTDIERTGVLKAWKPIARAEILSLDEERVEQELAPNDSSVEFQAAKRRIITLRVVLKD